MGKFNINTQSGMVSDLEKQAHADLPVAPEVEPAPAPEPQGGNLEALLAAPSAPETAPVQEEVGQDSTDRTHVPTIAERGKGLVTPVKWDHKRGKPLPITADGDGGVTKRAQAMTAKYENNNVWGGGLGLSPQKAGNTLLDTMTKIGAVMAQDKVEKPDNTGLGINTQLDPALLMIGSAATEHMITRLAAGKPATVSFQQEKVAQQAEEEGVLDPNARNVVGKATGNTELGFEITRDYARYKNAQEGRQTDDYADVSPEEAALIGDAFKEMYSAANPDLLKRVDPVAGSQTQHTTFQLTPEGETVLNSPAAVAKRKAMFPGVNVRPSKSKIGGQLQSEVGRVATKKRSGKVKGTPAGAQVIEEAMKNLSNVANVVDNQRLKILYMVTLPLLAGQEADPRVGDLVGIGPKQVAKFSAAEKAAIREGKDYDPVENLELLQNKIAQEVRAAAMERGGANYLSYYMQNFNGRISPQQSFFDPTSSKVVRFVTRNAVPAKATPGSRIDKNLRQMYAMMLVKDADALLPEGREQALRANTSKLEAWGLRLKELVENTVSDADLDAISEAIAEGQALTDQNFPNIPQLQLDPETDAELINQILKKGEDGMHYIDGLIDFANYQAAMRRNQPHFSYFNAYMDGKTNGIASNGIQMGSRDIAFKTGVMRTNGETLLDQDQDVRDALMKELTNELDITGLQTSQPELYTVSRALYNYRQLAKDTTMTFGYGKEFESFRADISDALDLLLEQDAIDPEGGSLTAAMEVLMQDGDRDSLVETLWSNYVNHLGGALSPEALEARPIMRAAATQFALMDRVFNIETATGLELNLGGEIAEGIDAAGYSETAYTIGGKGRRSQRFSTRSTAAAAKGDQGPGSRAYGGSLPGPVQSLDAATVAMTASGRSWERLSNASNGNPYMHTIYDAFKVDAMGYDVVLDEVNKNWLDASMEWSYLEATLKSLENNVKEFQQELNQYPDSLPIDTSPTGEYLMFGHMMSEFENDAGEVGPWNLVKMLRKSLPKEQNMSEEEHKRWMTNTKRMGINMMADMKKAGFKPDQPTIRDLKQFMKAWGGQVNLRGRLNSMINRTNDKKAKLRKEIKEAGVPVYQYYAH